MWYNLFMFSNPEKILIQFGVSRGLHVADFGAGSGYYAMLLADKVGDSGRVYAIDAHKDMVRRLARQAVDKGMPQLEAAWGDLEKDSGSGLPDASVDAVVIANTLFAVEDKKAFAKEVVRVLRKKGRVLLVEWSDSFAGMGPHQDHVVNADDAKKIFADAGLVFDHDIEAGEHHYGLVFRL
jgi:ubiquinone/menaquinone biosynthesis C-methylase UbiE